MTNRVGKLLLTIGLSIVIALSLTFLPGTEERTRDEQNLQAVVSLTYGRKLNDDNLVDYVARMPFKLGIRSLDWREPILHVDYYLQEGTVNRERIFTDIRHICDFGIRTMRNVEQVLVRLYDTRAQDAQLLLAVSADRGDITLSQDDDDMKQVDAERYVNKWYHVQSTARWIQLFGEV